MKNQIAADFRTFSGGDLSCFFDVENIECMDDWRHRILAGLREANLLLLVLSPAYLESKYCEWEITEFLKYEHLRVVGGEGVAPVYFVEIPGLDEPGFEERAATWLARVRRRNQVDLRPWFNEGSEALKRSDVRRRLQELAHSLHARLVKLRRLREATGNLRGHNPRFVGRVEELQRLHAAVGGGQFGVLTAVQGMGGVGKTGLAIQYAYAFADFYPGGRWLAGCAGFKSLAGAIRQLDVDLDIVLNDVDSRDDSRAAQRVLAELERRSIAGAAAHAGEKNAPQPRALLLLDNIDHPELLRLPESDLLNGREWLSVLITTRCSTEDIVPDPGQLNLLSVDELSEDDALRLIMSYQPEGRSLTKEDTDAVREMIKLLRGFGGSTLAIEGVAVYLGERAGRMSCQDFLARMRKDGVGQFDEIIRDTKNGIAHGEKLISLTLKPSLDLMTPTQTNVLLSSAMLPPDKIPVAWLRAIASENVPELARDAGPGYDDPWLDLLNHLIGIRLLQVQEISGDKGLRYVRMHRLVQSAVLSYCRQERAAHQLRVDAQVHRYVEVLEQAPDSETIRRGLSVLISQALYWGATRHPEAEWLKDQTRRFRHLLDERLREEFSVTLKQFDSARRDALIIGWAFVAILLTVATAAIASRSSAFRFLLPGVSGVLELILFVETILLGMLWAVTADKELQIWKRWLASNTFKAPPMRLIVTGIGLQFGLLACSVTWLPAYSLLTVGYILMDIYLWRVRYVQLDRMAEDALALLKADESLAEDVKDLRKAGIGVVRNFYTKREQEPRLKRMACLYVGILPLAVFSTWPNRLPVLQSCSYSLLIIALIFGEAQLWPKRQIMYGHLRQRQSKAYPAWLNVRSLGRPRLES